MQLEYYSPLCTISHMKLWVVCGRDELLYTTTKNLENIDILP